MTMRFMELSKRITGLTEGADGWDIFRKARRMKADGIDMVELTIGEHDRRTDPAILDAMHAAATAGHTGYSAIPGTDTLRDAIARRVAERTGVPTGHENVVVCPGGQFALFAAHAAVCDPGDTSLMIDPYYATYPGTIRAAGALPVPVPARPERGFQPDPGDLASAAMRARSLLINSPNNPTGAVYAADTLEGIADMCRENDLWLISDEVYDTQIWDGAHLSPRQLPGMADRTLVVGSVSKSHAMTGSRLGWIVGPEAAIEHLCNLTTHTTYGVPGFIQDAAEFALAKGAPLEERIAAPFKHRHEVAKALLSERGLGVVPSKATMYLMVDIRPTGLSGTDFAERLLEQHRIAVMPGESFGDAAACHIRLALTVEDVQLLWAVDTLADFFHTLTEAAA